MQKKKKNTKRFRELFKTALQAFYWTANPFFVNAELGLTLYSPVSGLGLNALHGTGLFHAVVLASIQGTFVPWQF